MKWKLPRLPPPPPPRTVALWVAAAAVNALGGFFFPRVGIVLDLCWCLYCAYGLGRMLGRSFEVQKNTARAEHDIAEMERMRATFDSIKSDLEAQKNKLESTLSGARNILDHCPCPRCTQVRAMMGWRASSGVPDAMTN